jgi:TIR domain
MSGQIFISYRREDTEGHTGRLYARLHARFPQKEIFMDVDGLEPGVSLVKTIQESLACCDVLVAVIGRRWLT